MNCARLMQRMQLFSDMWHFETCYKADFSENIALNVFDAFVCTARRYFHAFKTCNVKNLYSRNVK